MTCEAAVDTGVVKAAVVEEENSAGKIIMRQDRHWNHHSGRIWSVEWSLDHSLLPMVNAGTRLNIKDCNKLAI